jgi:hypothetical protein
MRKETKMSDLLLSAVFGSFIVVRLMKGPWLKNPQYLAAAILGSIVGALLMHSYWPGLDDDLIASSITGLAGPIAGMLLFDAVLMAVA